MLEKAPATAAIGAVTAFIGLALILTGNVDYTAVYAGFIPARFGGAEAGFLNDAGLLPAWLTPFSATLVHGGFTHLLFNMVMLLIVGKATEIAIGTRGILALYLVGAVASVFAHWVIDPNSTQPMIGASGAVSAIVGAYAILYGRQRTGAIGPFSPRLVQIAWLIGAWTAINLLIGFLTAGTDSPIAAAAHVGGFIAGVVLVRPLLEWQWREA
ncbi:rhomboid family intramembrane serine protease [Sphingomonas qomolangmaensis]|uniref:Rhomboid family intramembrane serine protease n=1 Tax=Sphingomonas qomolangmaensis TaxID=2918765 RepID=A0ABY5LC03_9SPHN|nr:rhomboid family intramembrane serine protease [Sphingomonas qomolangmaensis]UUL83329.1 rhomboid family intramembrane serine protease [Sphingomonas qomolangmaensis]